jgi:hypothetical protein
MLTIAMKIGFVDFLTHKRSVCLSPPVGLSSRKPVTSGVLVFFQGVKAYCPNYTQVAVRRAAGHGAVERSRAHTLHVHLQVQLVGTCIGLDTQAIQKVVVTGQSGACHLFLMNATSRPAKKGLCFAKSLVRGPWGAIR